MNSTTYQSVSITLPRTIVKLIDAKAKKRFSSRSETIKNLLLDSLMPVYKPSPAEAKAIAKGLADIESGNVVEYSKVRDELFTN